MVGCLSGLGPGLEKSALGFLHSRTNLSPFTKDFRGGDQLDEYLTIFLRSGLLRPTLSNETQYAKRKVKSSLICSDDDNGSVLTILSKIRRRIK